MGVGPLHLYFFYIYLRFMIYHRVCNQINTTTSVTSGVGILVGFVILDLQFYMYALQIVVCPFVLFFSPLCCLLIRYTNYDYPFGILKLFSPLPIFPGKSKQFVSLIKHVSWTIWVVGLPSNSYKPITNTAWVRVVFVNYKQGALDSHPQVIKFASCLPMVSVLSWYSGFFHH